MCVPILPIVSYLELFRVPALVDKHLDTVRRATAESVQSLAQQLQRSALSEERALEWLLEAGPTRVIDRLQLSETEPAALQLHSLHSVLVQSRSKTSLQDQLAIVQSCRTAMDPKTLPDYAERQLVTCVRDLVASPPKDVHLVSEVSPRHQDGYAIMLRFTEQVMESSVELTPQDSTRAFRRVAHIEEPYVYSISQRFGLLFTGIGLPDEHYASLRITGELVIDQFAATKARL
jgi:hypothetical protein